MPGLPDFYQKVSQFLSHPFIFIINSVIFFECTIFIKLVSTSIHVSEMLYKSIKK